MIRLPQHMLEEGDVVQVHSNGYGTGTVDQVEIDTVTILRPYIHHDGPTGINYIGTEYFTLSRSNKMINVCSGPDLMIRIGEIPGEGTA